MKRTVLVGAAVCSLLVIGTVEAQRPGPRGMGRGPGRGLPDGVTRTVTQTETGAVIEVSSDDPEQVKWIQARHAETADAGPWSARAGIEHAVTNLENGVAVEVTSDNPEQVALIQARFAVKAQQVNAAPGAGRGIYRDGRGFGNNRRPRGLGLIEGAERKVTNTETGVRIEISSDDPAVVEQIHARMAAKPDNASDKPAGRPYGNRGFGRKHGRGGGGPCGAGLGGQGRGVGQRGVPRGFGLMRPIAGTVRTVTNLENGVRIEITSDDADIVASLQEQAASWVADVKSRICPFATNAQPSTPAEPATDD